MPMPNCDPCCNNPPCPNCLGGYGPKRWKVVVAGIISRGPCSPGPGSPDCTDLNGTFYVDNEDDTGSCCKWSLLIGAWLCGFSDVLILLEVCSDHTITVRWTGSAATDPCPCIAFTKTYPSLPDCRHIIDDALTLVSGYDNGCDFSGATVTISAAE